jgi:dTDP-4-amino-4,6-dideoxygalactose transaminase
MHKKSKRIYLSPPDLTNLEIDFVVAAMQSGWVSSQGPDVKIFEQEMATFCESKNAVSLSSGTAAIHLGLMALGVKSGDQVVVPTLTFAATAFAVSYIGAHPVFIDSELESWNLDPTLLEEYLKDCEKNNKFPSAIIVVDVFGKTCDYTRILEIAKKYDIKVLADSAEALGAFHQNKPAGSLGDISIVSFNGNKIMTTSGGGMLLTNNDNFAQKVRFWSNQSRESFAWYEHNEIGFNYRMSNILAALGNAQLKRLPEMLSRRLQIRNLYEKYLDHVDGLQVKKDPYWGKSNNWLTTIRIDTKLFPNGSTRIREFLETENIESRPIWKPMHRQPVFKKEKSVLNGVSETLFNEGLCLPSGSNLSDEDVVRISKLILSNLLK